MSATPTYAAHAKESGHWYYRHTKQLVETVPYANGKMGPPDLRHARKLRLLPGVTTITKCAASFGLENWKRDQVLMAALTTTRAAGETDAHLVRRILDDSEQQASDAAKRGTAIHAAIQEYYTSGTFPTDSTMLEHVNGAAAAIRDVCGSRAWTPELCVIHSSGYATKIDLCCDAIILDFKSKDFGPDDCAKLKTYRDHAMQLAAGMVAMAGPMALVHTKAAIIYVSRSYPGLSWPVAVGVADLRRGWEMFQALLAFWKADNKYDPSWETT